MKLPLKFKKKRYGVVRAVDRVREVLLTSQHLEGKFYEVWLSLTEYKRKKLLEELRKVVKEEVLGKEFTTALAEEVFYEGEVDVHSPVFKYVKERVFHGDVRELMKELQDVLEKEEKFP